MRYPFEADLADLLEHMDSYIGVIFASLESEFLVMPKGKGFVDYAVFEAGYEALKRASNGFASLLVESVLAVAQEAPMSLIVLRAMLGLTPPEWAYLAVRHTGIEVPQGFARTLDRRIRMNPLTPLSVSCLADPRFRALVETACHLLNAPAPAVRDHEIHRLDKADTREGMGSIRAFADLGVPYAMLLYERFLGRPFAGHRDSVSELIGDALEGEIEARLSTAGISYRKTKRAEKIIGFDQAPDFIVPSEFNPQVVIEAKITEDDGTARDKVTRIQHLAELAAQRLRDGQPGFQVVACIGGRGFGVRREDARKLLLAT